VVLLLQHRISAYFDVEKGHWLLLVFFIGHVLQLHSVANLFLIVFVTVIRYPLTGIILDDEGSKSAIEIQVGQLNVVKILVLSEVYHVVLKVPEGLENLLVCFALVMFNFFDHAWSLKIKFLVRATCQPILRT